VAGILVEGENLPTGRMAGVVGIGVNCVGHPEVLGRLAATDLAERGMAVGAEDLFAALARRMAEEIESWDRGNGFGATRLAWLQRAAGIGQPIRVNLRDRSVEGRFEALDDAGRLVLSRSDGGREAFSAGDVFFAAAG
jgi:BirA family biotin operon repressor/biotin-[acetyl-CoA-carboxylase] ligase